MVQYKHFFLSFLLIFVLTSVRPQGPEQTAEAFQTELDKEYRNPETSPLRDKAKKFKGHDFFPIDSLYRVEAAFIRTLNALPFQMKTTTSRLPTYEKYGEAVFSINGREYRLSIYQSHQLRQTEAYEDYLFLPFTDQTNGTETYGGGRFIDLTIPEGEVIVIDFNKAYNPYYAYNKDYSCPIPPKENDLDTSVRAGIKKPKK